VFVTQFGKGRMYVCLCNAISDRDLHSHTAGGTCSVAMVYQSLGCKPECGKCVPMVRQALRQAAESATSGKTIAAH